jgi:hypothetical protein
MAKRLSHPRSWIDPEIHWTDLTRLFMIEVPTFDCDLLELLATGQLEIGQISSGAAGQAMVALVEDVQPLRAALMRATRKARRLKPLVLRSKKEPDRRISRKVTAYCHGLIHLPDSGKVAVLVGRFPSVVGGPWLPDRVKAAAVESWEEHCKALKVVEAERDRIRIGNREFVSKLPEGKRGLEVLLDLNVPARPIPSLTSILECIPVGITVSSKAESEAKRNAAALTKMALSVLEPSRDGEYLGAFSKGLDTQSVLLVSWKPRNELPPYPEVRAAVQKSLPSAFSKPRHAEVSPPDLDLPSGSLEASEVTAIIEGLDTIDGGLLEGLRDIRIDGVGFGKRVEEGRRLLCGQSFDAIGWYQPYHVYTEDTWGIYLNAEKLGMLACALHYDLLKAKEPSQGLAALLAVQLVYRHELFHARVEAVLSWLELSSARAKHHRYWKDVYTVARGTDAWLEEALANWWSWAWLKSALPELKAIHMARSEANVERVVEANLNLSPLGYSNWRSGDRRETWRTFSSELSVSTLGGKLRGMELPIESILKDPLPFELLDTDIPTRLVGHGFICDLLFLSPNTVRTISRREAEKVLKHFGYSADSSRGKGSHEMWTGPDNRGFPLPKRDPLSDGVFSSFLHHLGVNKAKYVNEIRRSL